MTSLKILQYNTDNLRHGWDYFKEQIKDADLAVLQRFPRAKRQELMDLMQGCRAYMLESCPPGNLCLAIARSNNAPSFSGTESITLPSAQHVIALGDEWQGCTALKTVMSGVNIVSFLPCYATEVGEYPLTETDTLTDIKHIIHKFKDEPTIIMGDFHIEGACVWWQLAARGLVFGARSNGARFALIGEGVVAAVPPLLAWNFVVGGFLCFFPVSCSFLGERG